jgi:hypothetical protein
MTWFTWAFAAMTVVFFALQLGEVDWDKVTALPSGPFLAGFVGGMSVATAGLGIGWINAAADYSHYLPQRSSSGGIVGWTLLGASLGPVALIAFGILLAANNDQLANESNLIGALAEPLPTWFLVPYLLVSVGGLLAGAVIDMYSSGLNLLTLGVRLPRYQSILIDGAIMLAGNIYLLFFAPDFVGPFQGFLITLGVPLAAWGAIFLVDLAMYRWREGYDELALYDPSARYGAVNPAGLIAWIVAVVGLGLVTSTAAIFGWTGYLLDPFGGEESAVGASSIGLWIAFALAAILYTALSPCSPAARAPPPSPIEAETRCRPRPPGARLALGRARRGAAPPPHAGGLRTHTAVTISRRSPARRPGCPGRAGIGCTCTTGPAQEACHEQAAHPPDRTAHGTRAALWRRASRAQPGSDGAGRRSGSPGRHRGGRRPAARGWCRHGLEGPPAPPASPVNRLSGRYGLRLDAGRVRRRGRQPVVMAALTTVMVFETPVTKASAACGPSGSDSSRARAYWASWRTRS